MDPTIADELDKELESRRVFLEPPLTHEVDEAIKRADREVKVANREVERQLREHISVMDATVFEWLIRLLFLKLGYRIDRDPKRGADGGIDVRATLVVAGGIGGIRTCIQVKRQPSVGRPDVQKLRGALGVHETGVLVTSGEFANAAVEEAKDNSKAPIILIGGSKLTELLIEHQIGVRRRELLLYTLEPDELSKEQLEGRVEETGESES